MTAHNGLWRVCVTGLLLVSFAVAACSETGGGTIPSNIIREITPPVMPMTGGVAVEIRDSTVQYDLNRGVSVTIGGIRCLEPKLVNRNHIRCYCQGYPQPGPREVIVSQPGGPDPVTYPDAITFDPAANAAISSIWAIGGSTGAGVESGSLYLNMQVQSPVVQLARALGIFIGLPLISSEGLPIKSAICSTDPVTGVYTADYGAVLAMTPGEIADLRYDADIEVRNLAVPHTTDVRWLLDGFPDNLAGQYAHLIPGGEGDRSIMNRLPEHTMDVLVVGPDIWLRYIEDGILGDELVDAMDALFDVLSGFAPETAILVADVPDVSLTPGAGHLRMMRYRTMYLNKLLRQRIAGHGGMVHVSVFDVFNTLAKAGDGDSINMFGQNFAISHGANGEPDMTLCCAAAENGCVTLGFDRFEGLYSYDGHTLTSTGNALMANAFIAAINDHADVFGNAAALAYIDICNANQRDYRRAAVQDAERNACGFPAVETFMDTDITPAVTRGEECLMSDEEDMMCPATVVPDMTGPVLVMGMRTDIGFTVNDARGVPVPHTSYVAWIDNPDIVMVTGEGVTNENGKGSITLLPPMEESSNHLMILAGDALIRQTILIATH